MSHCVTPVQVHLCHTVSHSVTLCHSRPSPLCDTVSLPSKSICVTLCHSRPSPSVSHCVTPAKVHLCNTVSHCVTPVQVHLCHTVSHCVTPAQVHLSHTVSLPSKSICVTLCHTVSLQPKSICVRRLKSDKDFICRQKRFHLEKTQLTILLWPSARLNVTFSTFNIVFLVEAQ